MHTVSVDAAKSSFFSSNEKLRQRGHLHQ